MSEEKGPFFSVNVKNQEESIRLTERLFEVTEPGAVFSKPVKSGEHTLITASEVSVGLGSGYGYGEGGPPPESENEQPYGSGGGVYITCREFATKVIESGTKDAAKIKTAPSWGSRSSRRWAACC